MEMPDENKATSYTFDCGGEREDSLYRNLWQDKEKKKKQEQQEEKEQEDDKD